MSNTTPSYAAIFSCDAGVPAAITITSAGQPYTAVATYHPSAGDNPLKYLASQGWALAHRNHSYLFKATMAATGYANVPVVPTR